MSEAKPNVLTEAQTMRVYEILQSYFRPQSDEDRALEHAVRFISAMSTARDVLPLVASCLEAATSMMGNQDLSTRAMYKGIRLYVGLMSIEDPETLAVVEKRLDELAEVVNEAIRPLQRPGDAGE